MARDGKMDVHLDVSRNGYGGRLEVIEGPTGRRRSERFGEGADRGREPDAGRDGCRCGPRARDDAVAGVRLATAGAGWPAGAVGGDIAVGRLRGAGGRGRRSRRRGRHGSGIEVVVGDVMIRAAPDAGEAHLARVIRAARAAR